MGIKMKRSFLFRKDSTIIDTFTSRIIVFMDRVCNRCIQIYLWRIVAAKWRPFEDVTREPWMTTNLLLLFFPRYFLTTWLDFIRNNEIIRKLYAKQEDLLFLFFFFFFYDYFQFVDSFWLNVSVKCGAVSFDVNSFFFFFFSLRFFVGGNRRDIVSSGKEEKKKGIH